MQIEHLETEQLAKMASPYYHRTASASSSGTPSPLSYMNPRLSGLSLARIQRNPTPVVLSRDSLFMGVYVTQFSDLQSRWGPAGGPAERQWTHERGRRSFWVGAIRSRYQLVHRASPADGQ